MQPFDFHSASSEDDAIALLTKLPDAKYLAGGTTLVDLMKHLVERPANVVDINGLASTKVEELPDGGVRIGALVRNSDLAHHPLIQSRYPMLSQALLAGASAQL